MYRQRGTHGATTRASLAIVTEILTQGTNQVWCPENSRIRITKCLARRIMPVKELDMREEMDTY